MTKFNTQHQEALVWPFHATLRGGLSSAGIRGEPSLTMIQLSPVLDCGPRPEQVFKLSRGGLPDLISLMHIYLPLLIQ